MKKLINRLLIYFGWKREEWVEVIINEPLEPITPIEVEVEMEEPIDFVEMEPWNGKPTVAIDFDGVIHSYTSGWLGADEILDPPVSKWIARSKRDYTSIDWLTELVESDQMNVAIFSSRNHQRGGIKAMKAYLMDNGMDHEILMKIAFPEHKPPSHVLIDDRCMTFKGLFYSVDQILNFKPWKP